MSAPLSPLRILRHLLWGVAVVCLGAWGWARLDAARFQAEAERRLDGARVESAAAALERAVERDLRQATWRAESGFADDDHDLAGTGATGGAEPAATPAAAEPAATQPSPTPAVVRLGASQLLGRVRIPRIGLSVVVAEGIDGRTLRRAAGRIPGTAPLGGGGNTGVAGHRDGVFRDLERAAAGDLVLVETPAGTERYRVEAVSIVPPGATDVLADDGRSTLTLVTCYPFEALGPAPERWIVRAVHDSNG
jgi:LPXTG-site transpeptidase (sortase) family protein